MLEGVEDAVAELATTLDVAERVAKAVPLEMLPILATAAARLELIVRSAVHRARLQGATLDELGTALGLPADEVAARFYPGHKDVDGAGRVDRPHP